MKSILLIAACIVAMGFAVASCRFAPSPKLGDTVASSVFEPADTGLINKKTRAKVADTTIVADSVGLYYIGSGSTKQFLQLVSYPSRFKLHLWPFSSQKLFCRRQSELLSPSVSPFSHEQRAFLARPPHTGRFMGCCSPVFGN